MASTAPTHDIDEGGRTSASSVPPPSRRSAIRALRDLAEAARGLGRPSLESQDVDALAVRARAVLEQGVAVLSDMQRQEALDDTPELESLDDLFSEEAPKPRSRPGIADLCFAGLMETKGSLRELTEAADTDARLAAVESAGRKLRRALRAILALAAEGTSVPPAAAPNEELETALEVRRAYATFRRGLRRADGPTPEAALRAVQYAAGAIANLVGSREYASVRASDRAMLRGLRERAFAWARGTRSVPAGLALLEDIHTSANLLRGINQRQELRGHDWDALARLPGAAPEERLVLLMRLEGLDDGLDGLIDQVRKGQHTDELWRLVSRRIGDLR